MRKITAIDMAFYDCEWCGDFKNGACPHPKCPYKSKPINHKKKQPKRERLIIDKPKPVLTDAIRSEFFPKSKLSERYNIKRIIGLHLEGKMAVQIAKKMGIKPQEVGDIILKYNKGELDGLF